MIQEEFWRKIEPTLIQMKGFVEGNLTCYDINCTSTNNKHRYYTARKKQSNTRYSRVAIFNDIAISMTKGSKKGKHTNFFYLQVRSTYLQNYRTPRFICYWERCSNAYSEHYLLSAYYTKSNILKTIQTCLPKDLFYLIMCYAISFCKI